MRHTVILHHSHTTRDTTQSGSSSSLGAVGRLMRTNASGCVLLWVVHHVLRLLARLLRLLVVVGVKIMGLLLLRGRAIGVELSRIIWTRTITISRTRCVHGGVPDVRK